MLTEKISLNCQTKTLDPKKREKVQFLKNRSETKTGMAKMNPGSSGKIKVHFCHACFWFGPKQKHS